MTQILIVRADAEDDIEKAFNWYEDQRVGLGLDFLLAVEASLAVVERDPLRYPLIYKQARRILLRRFPYGLFYIVGDGVIEVLACMHHRRHPRKWRRRTSG